MIAVRNPAQPPPAPVIDHMAFPIALGFVAGFIDLYGFVAWHGLLAAHVTGNLIFLALSIARGHYDLVMKLLALPMFALSVAASAWVFERWTARGWHPLRPALMVEAAAIALCMLVGLVLPFPDGPDDAAAVIAGSTALFAMALQNTTMRMILNNLPPTTVMTGNITYVMSETTRRFSGFGAAMPARETAALPRRARLIAATLAAFTAGAIAGGTGALHLGGWALLLPIAALIALLPAERAVMRAAAQGQSTA